MKAFLKQALTSEYPALLFRICVGLVFIYASMGKISIPGKKEMVFQKAP